MTKISDFDPPASLTDFDPTHRAAWSEFIGATLDDNIKLVESAVGHGNSPFYDQTKTDTDPPVASDVIRWKGFPLLIAAKHPGDKPAAWKEADKPLPDGERPQDEYLEWFVVRDAHKKITKVTFTCEGPEYWEALANGYPKDYNGPKTAGAKGMPDKLLALYQQFVSPEVKLADLLEAHGRYSRLNKWNTKHGAIHLNQRNNTLSAEINIAAQATILRQQNGQVLTDPDALIRCAQYGQPGRASDPKIGAEVNSLARQGFAISLQDPIGLYIDGLDTTGWSTPDGTPAAQFWKVVRGGAGTAVRAVFEVPSTAAYTVGDIKIGGQPLEFGGQLAEQITMKLTGIACRKGSKLNAAVSCVSAQALLAAPAGKSRF